MAWAGSVAMLGLVMALANAPASSITLAIDLSALAPMSDAERRAMIGETAALWKPHGVVLAWITAEGRRDALPHPVVRVLTDGCRVEPLCLPSDAKSLGAVVFVEGSATPEDTLLLSVGAVVQTVESVKWQSRNLVDLPTDTRGYLIGRALGRVLAHEIGHYLLASRFHTEDGLMRPEFRADQLIAMSRQGFTLSKMQVPWLRLRLAQLARGTYNSARFHPQHDVEPRHASRPVRSP
jgi:hypothetical protein